MRVLGLFSTEKRGYKDGRPRLFSVVPSASIRGNGYKLKHRGKHQEALLYCAGGGAVGLDHMISRSPFYP